MSVVLKECPSACLFEVSLGVYLRIFLPLTHAALETCLAPMCLLEPHNCWWGWWAGVTIPVLQGRQCLHSRLAKSPGLRTDRRDEGGSPGYRFTSFCSLGAMPSWSVCPALNQRDLGSDSVPATPKLRDLGWIPAALSCPTGVLSESHEIKHVKGGLVTQGTQEKQTSRTNTSLLLLLLWQGSDDDLSRILPDVGKLRVRFLEYREGSLWQSLIFLR